MQPSKQIINDADIKRVVLARSISFVLILFFSSMLLVACSEQSNDGTTSDQKKLLPAKQAAYVGAQQCVACHQQQATLWKDSHHDLAMQPASAQTVLGDFNNTTFNYFGTISAFYIKNDQFYVQTDGPDGKLADYPIAYTFGVYPLQQYLIQFPKGHIQALSIAWDTRSKEEGGQRWFHLYPDEHIRHDDELHWTGINQNWNFMCADCHSTNLHKNYDLDEKEYKTTWSEIDVSCEACHGPASRHIDWADKQSPDILNKGFAVAFNERKNTAWTIDPATGSVVRSHKKKTNTEIEACAQCHSRRLTVHPGAKPEAPLLDNYQLSLLTEPLYHADGQIKGEVYVYGSFVQSKMYHVGVTCSDCHEPHSLELRAEGNNLCAQCHLPGKYNTTGHHLHKPDTTGSRCVACHMPAKNYMVVDPRRDHSLRIPRPDLSVKFGTPNACTECHADKTAKWAAQTLEHKYGKPDKKHYAEAINAGRRGLPQAEQLLSELITDDSVPAIARATAVTLLPPYLSRHSAPVLQMAGNDEEPLLGLGLAMALDAIPAQRRLPFAYPLLYDDMRSTRSLAAHALSGVSLQSLPAEAAIKFDEILHEYTAGQLFNADRPESLANLASIYAQQGLAHQAVKFYQDAITIAPYYTPVYVNLAEFYHRSGDDVAAEKVLRKALYEITDKTAVQHALGLLQVRQKKLSEAIEFLRMAAESPTSTDRYIYVYAIALHSSGNAKKALTVLEKAQKNYPRNTDILYALVSINREVGRTDRTKYYEKMLRKIIN